MRRGVRVAWVTLLIVTAFAAALWVMPARWLMSWVPESSPVVVTNASGTLWKARATVAVGAPGLRRTLPDSVQWDLTFKGGPHLALRHPWLRGPLDLALTWRGVKVSAQSLQLPASALTTAHALFNTLDPGGEVLLEWPDLLLGRTVTASQGTQLLTVEWRNASSSLTRIQPMGNYTLLLQLAANNTINLSLKTSQGPLMMEGSGMFSSSGRGEFDGKSWVDTSATHETRTALQGLLNAMGPRSRQEGEYLLQIR